MKRLARLAALAATATATTGLIAAPAFADPGSHHRNDRDVHALFVQTDEVSGNHVAAYRQHDDGSLTFTHSYLTGGNGGILPNSVIDHTASQGAVTYDEENQLLYVVNAGSNTVSVFGVDGTELSLRQVIGSGGTFR